MELLKYNYGYVPRQNHHKKRIKKKWAKKYGYCIGVTGVERVKVNEIKESLFNQIKDLSPKNPHDSYWNSFGTFDEGWHWDVGLMLGSMETLIDIQHKLAEEAENQD